MCKIAREILDRAECCADGRRPGRMGVCRAASHEDDHPECCSTICRAAAREVMNSDFTNVVNGNMNWSTVRYIAGVPFA